MPVSRDGSTQSPEGNSGGGSSNTRSQAINIANGPSVNSEFEQWSNPVQQQVYSGGMASQEYQMPNYYQTLSTGHYGLDPSSTWGGFNYNQPMNSPPTNPYASQMPAQMFSSDLNYGLQTYNVFGGAEYGQGWSPSFVAQPHADGRGTGTKAAAPPDPYYRSPAGYLSTGVDSYRELDHRMGAISLSGGNSTALSASGHLEHHSSGFGHSAPVAHHAPQSNKPLTWADKVKMAPKEAAPRKERPRIGAVSSAGTQRATVWSAGTVTSAAPTRSVAAPAKQQSPNSGGAVMSTGNGWTSGQSTGTVMARKPPPPPAAANAVSLSGAGDGPQVNGNAATEKTAAGEEGVELNPVLKKLKAETNPPTFNMPLQGARFFVIKSYSEDDVHRSIKYGIWCSTDHGNKRLDQAFKEREGKGPIYLFYSVNASGHFCGVAQMVSAVDYSKHSGVWAQDKWKGLFKVKWLYVKDVPNNQLRHIRLENNENKPVTNSRDTQEVPWEKGRGVLKVVHSFKHTTSLFDDFSHYEKRQAEEDHRKKGGDSD